MRLSKARMKIVVYSGLCKEGMVLTELKKSQAIAAFNANIRQSIEDIERITEKVSILQLNFSVFGSHAPFNRGFL
jgi:hypothetical protein